MSAKFIGAHVPTGKGLDSAVRTAKSFGCTAIQVFTTSPRQWKSAMPTPDKVTLFKRAVNETGITKLISHDTYLVNLCHEEEETMQKSMDTLRDELIRCSLYGIGLVVSHMGSYHARPQGEALAIVVEKTLEILKETPEDVTLLMETTAGQGSSVNSRFEEIAVLLEACGGHRRLGVCLDSAHIFVAGYDIRTKQAYEETMATFDRIVGIRNLKAIHLNDSKKPFGSHVDRHDNIGKGLIGPEAFECFVTDPRLTEIPMVVETPTENEGHETDVKTLWSLTSSITETGMDAQAVQGSSPAHTKQPS